MSAPAAEPLTHEGDQPSAVGAGTELARPRVLVAGIGNVFLGDDGFGVEVVDRLGGRPVPDGAKVVDFGIRGLHLAYELLDGYDALVLVDALPLGDEPGTVALVEAEMPGAPTDPDPEVTGPALDAHSMSPAVVLATLAHLGGSVDRVLVVGCQPATVAEGMGLSEVVAAAVDTAVAMVDDVLAELLPSDHPHSIPEHQEP